MSETKKKSSKKPVQVALVESSNFDDIPFDDFTREIAGETTFEIADTGVYVEIDSGAVKYGNKEQLTRYAIHMLRVAAQQVYDNIPIREIRGWTKNAQPYFQDVPKFARGKYSAQKVFEMTRSFKPALGTTEDQRAVLDMYCADLGNSTLLLLEEAKQLLSIFYAFGPMHPNMFQKLLNNVVIAANPHLVENWCSAIAQKYYSKFIANANRESNNASDRKVRRKKASGE
jgi:hypothetical protein